MDLHGAPVLSLFPTASPGQECLGEAQCLTHTICSTLGPMWLFSSGLSCREPRPCVPQEEVCMGFTCGHNPCALTSVGCPGVVHSLV